MMLSPAWLSSLANPRWADEARTIVMLNVMIGGFPQVFYAHPNDVHEHGRSILADCLAGKYGSIGDYVPRPPKEEASQ